MCMYTKHAKPWYNKHASLTDACVSVANSGIAMHCATTTEHLGSRQASRKSMQRCFVPGLAVFDHAGAVGVAEWLHVPSKSLVFHHRANTERPSFDEHQVFISNKIENEMQ
jgi:hypothetical protein